MIIQLEHIPHTQRNGRATCRIRLGQAATCPVLVDDHPLSTTQILEPSLHHRGRAAHQRRIIQSKQVDSLKASIGQARLQKTFVERHGPIDTFYTAHGVELGVLERLDIVDVLHLLVHHPDLRVTGVGDRAEGAEHDAREDGHLLCDQQRRTHPAQHDTEVPSLVADQHLERYKPHDMPRVH